MHLNLCKKSLNHYFLYTVQPDEIVYRGLSYLKKEIDEIKDDLSDWLLEDAPVYIKVITLSTLNRQDKRRLNKILRRELNEIDSTIDYYCNSPIAPMINQDWLAQELMKLNSNKNQILDFLSD